MLINTFTQQQHLLLMLSIAVSENSQLLLSIFSWNILYPHHLLKSHKLFVHAFSFLLSPLRLSSPFDLQSKIEEDTPFGRIARPFFFGNDDDFRNNRFKLIPKVIEFISKKLDTTDVQMQYHSAKDRIDLYHTEMRIELCSKVNYTYRL